MRWSLLFGLPVIALLAGVPICFGDVPKQIAANATEHLDVPALIDQLSDNDPAIRKNASDRLLSVCESAGAELIEAMDTAGPELRTKLSAILLHRNWMIPGDPEAVKMALAPYATLDAEGRTQIVMKLAELPAADTTNALMQILKFDPSTSVRWAAAQVLRNGNSRASQDQLRALSSDSKNPMLRANAPLLAACGWVWREADVHRTRDLLLRAVEIESRRPSAMNGQLSFAYLWLIQSDIDNRDYSAALQLLRDQALRTAWDDVYLPGPIASLISFHAEYGPFPGLISDLQTYRSYLGHPEMLYAFARMADRAQLPIASSVLSGTALLESGFSAEDHSRIAGFLIDQGWNDQAGRELDVALWFASGNQAANAYFQMARIAEQAGDEFAIATDLESALKRINGEMQRTTRFGEVLAWSETDAWAEVHWHYLRAAQKKNDMAGIHVHLEKLMELDRLGQILQKDPGLATDIVPALNQTGRTQDARKVFDSAYKNLKDAVAADPTEPEAKNNLAWLCARCNQRLDEAVALADQAVAAAPDNSAYLDTCAEAHFGAGQHEKAVALESRALRLKPNDIFMKEQLKRFQASKK